MMWVQVLITILAIALLGRLFVHVRQRRISWFSFLLWALLWVSVMLIFWNPEIASRLALIFGIGRGADLVVYSAIIVIFYLLFRISIKLEKINSDITSIVRDIALKHADQSKHKGSDTDRKP